MPLGLLDLSTVTDHLIALLNACVDGSRIWGVDGGGNPNGPPFNINVSGNPPDVLKAGEGCQLGLYLFHVSADKFQRNAPVLPPRIPPGGGDPRPDGRVPRLPFQPLSLELYYLLSAYSANDYVQEQQAMSVALKCFHERPIVRLTDAADGREEEFCLTMEAETTDDLGRLWQATTAPVRLSTVYRVSVVFIEPAEPAPPRPNPTAYSVSVQPTPLPFSPDTPQVVGTVARVRFAGPPGTDPERWHYDLSPAVAAPGERLTVWGVRLGIPGISDRVFLLPPGGGAEQDVSAWIVAPAAPADPPVSTEARFVLQVPVGGAAPAPGVYQLRVGNGAALRSNATPFSIAARVDPAGGPVLAGGPTFTVNGSGFVAGQTEVLLETVPLAPVAGVPGAGEFRVADPSTLLFRPPAGLPAGRYALRVRVNGVESTPAKWVVVP
jgi:hypothetical protein